ncbi:MULTISPECIES: hypothetical protein [Amycolatopsis]|uniref:hypothetical protein n=1 Tax=Amycolatopsis TaxID=1813 RepID=UPI00040A5C8B|nr:hypothetical protein [Amycolatopsis thermoflava]
MVTSEDEITRRLRETDSARSVRRAHAATTVGQLARRHAELAGQLAELERELGDTLTAAGDVIDVAELSQVTDIPVADLARWRDHAAKPHRGGKRKRPAAKQKPASGKEPQQPTSTVAARTVTPAAPDSTAVAVGAAST